MNLIRPRAAIWVAIPALLLTLPTLTKLHAQKPQAIRSSSSLVLVPVNSLDHSGHFVSSLTARDFQILVDGKPVEISSLDAITEESHPAAAQRSTTVSASPNTLRNISESSTNELNLVVLLVDYLNTRMVERMQLREELLKFFSAKLSPDQEIAVYGLTHSLVLLQPFTRDSSALITAAKEMLKQKGQAPDPKISRPLYSPSVAGPPNAAISGTDAVIEYFSLLNARREYNIDQTQRATNTLAAFRELSASLGGIPGKKTVIWLTGDASPLNPTLLYNIIPDVSVEKTETSWWQTAKTYEALNAAGMSIFPVNLEGIVNTGLPPIDGFRSHTEFAEDIAISQPGDLTPYSQGTDTRQGEAARSVLAMETVAAETGGTVLSGSNDISDLLGRAHKLWANYYVLAFVPEKPQDESLPSYHKIKVNVDRKGVHVLARRGYVSRPEAMIAAETEIQRDLIEATASPIDLTSVALQLSLARSKDVNRLRHYPFSLIVSGSVLGTPSEKGAPYDLSVAILVRNQDGKTRSAFGERLRNSMPPAMISRAALKGLSYKGEFQAPVGAPYFGRVIVRDNFSGRIGSITLALPSVSNSPRI